MALTYDEALEYILSARQYNSKPGLLRIQNLLREMGNPEKTMKYVHVAGTNGKGSAVAMVGSVLKHVGFRTGMFISPYLERFNERMQINGEPISDEALALLTDKVITHIDSMVKKDLLPPSFFEMVTAMAFDYWMQEKCDYVSLEVGMGGEFDATNVIEAPAVAIITSISLDHTAHLGNTLSEIAFTKCGIVKPGSHVICYAEQPDEARTVIKRICHERGAEFIQPDATAVEVISDGIYGTKFRYKGIETTVPLMGRHQIINAIGVIEAMRALQVRGENITDEDIALGIAETEWVGRLEVVSENPFCVIDAAHNPDAVKVLCDSIDKLFSGCEIVGVMGILGDKDYEKCIPEIAKRCKTLITTTPTSTRALPAAETAEIAGKYCSDVETIEDICEATDRALELAKDGKMVLICGSLYIIGIAKTHIRQKYDKG